MNTLITIIIVLLLIKWVHSQRRIELFGGLVPTSVIDPMFYPIADAAGLTGCGSDRRVYEQVGDGRGVDLACHNVNLSDIVQWIARDDPRLMFEAVLRFDPSINPMNPYHTTRVLRLLMMNLPAYANINVTADKYMPIIQKCFPMGVRV